MEQALRDLNEANIALSKSLWKIRSSVTVYSVIGLNASRIETGKGFFGFVQSQQIDLIAIDFSKIFEIEKSFRLNSIPSIVRFIEESKMVPTNPEALPNYLGHENSETWTRDLQAMLGSQYSKYKKEISRIREARNSQIAHSQFGIPKNDLPSVAVFQELLDLAFRFHDLINSAFLNTHSHPILTDTQVQTSLVSVLQKIGLADVTTAWPD